MKLTGAVLVLLGGFAAFLDYSRTLRREVALISDLSGALTQLAGEIRWKMISLPEGIRGLAIRRESGKYFENIVKRMGSNITLQEAWCKEFSFLPKHISDILCRMEWGGDVRRQEASILYAAERLTELGASKRDARRQREKVFAAASFSVAGLLILILL